MCFFMIIVVVGCTEIPELGSIAPDIRYKNRKQFAITGLQQNIGDFQASTSTLPLHFEIVEIRETNGKSIDAFFEEMPVIEYIKGIDGSETEDELLLKIDTVMKAAMTLNSNTGKIELLEGNRIPEGEYYFDIEVSNTSGKTVLKDAMIIEFKEFELVSWSRGMSQEPTIERTGDSPNQILFKGYLDGEALSGDRIDFTTSRSSGFKGTFVDDTQEGEVWKIGFPVKESNTFCTWKIIEEIDGEEQIRYVTENFNFILGRPGSYVIKLYK